MKIKTWKIESAVVLLILVVQMFFTDFSLQEIIGSLAVWLTFMHAQVADRMQEKMAAQVEPDVECYKWSNRYFMGKELLWVIYFAMTGAFAAITGAVVFLFYPLWRKVYRRVKPEKHIEDRAIETLEKYHDLLYRDGNYNIVDDLLRKVDIEKEHPRILLGISSITFPFKLNLKEREEFFRKVENKLGEPLTRGLR